MPYRTGIGPVTSPTGRRPVDPTMGDSVILGRWTAWVSTSGLETIPRPSGPLSTGNLHAGYSPNRGDEHRLDARTGTVTGGRWPAGTRSFQYESGPSEAGSGCSSTTSPQATASSVASRSLAKRGVGQHEPISDIGQIKRVSAPEPGLEPGTTSSLRRPADLCHRNSEALYHLSYSGSTFAKRDRFIGRRP